MIILEPAPATAAPRTRLHPSIAAPVPISAVTTLPISRARRLGYRPLTTEYTAAEEDALERECGRLIATGATIALVPTDHLAEFPLEIWRRGIRSIHGDAALADAMHDDGAGHCNAASTR